MRWEEARELWLVAVAAKGRSSATIRAAIARDLRVPTTDVLREAHRRASPLDGL